MDDSAALMHLYIVGDLIVCLIQKQWQGFVNVKKNVFVAILILAPLTEHTVIV